MALVEWSATVGGNNIPGIQQVSVRQGQNKITDTFRSATATISGRDPDSLPTINIGDLLTLTHEYATFTRSYSFRVADYQVDYGITNDYDSWSISCEDAFAVLGRATVDISWASGTLAQDNAEDVCDLVGVSFSKGTSLTSTATCNAQTITNGNALDILNTLANTEGARLSAGGNSVQWLPRDWQSVVSTVYATDDPSSVFLSDPVNYDSITFTSLADNLADYAVVNVRAGNSVATGTGIYSINLDTYSVSDAEAGYAGQFELAQLVVDEPVPNRISYKLNTQTTLAWLDWDNYKRAVIVFRGVEYNVFVIGVTYSANVSETRVTWDVASSEFYRFLTLDDLVLGQLDYNKLGW